MTWGVGDLALCVDARPHPFWGESGLHVGATYRVVGVVYNPAPSALYGREDYGLFLAGVVSGTEEGFASQRFRKILPDAHEACEEEFVTLLKRTKRKVSA
jgi:hypothetical protein